MEVFLPPFAPGSHDSTAFCAQSNRRESSLRGKSYECSLASIIVSAFGPTLELDITFGLSLDLLVLRLLSISITAILSDRNNYGSEF